MQLSISLSTIRFTLWSYMYDEITQQKHSNADVKHVDSSSLIDRLSTEHLDS